jgi:hypothetical protein
MAMQEVVVVVFVFVCAGGAAAAVWIRVRWILLVAMVHGDGGAVAGVDGCYEF